MSVFTDPAAKLYVQFLHAVLPAFDQFNVMLQTEAPMIHRLHPAAMKLYTVSVKFYRNTINQANNGAIRTQCLIILYLLISHVPISN